MRKLLYPAFVAALFTCLFLLGCGPDSGDDRLDGSGTAADSAGSLAITLLATDSVTVLDLLKVDHTVEYHSSAMGLFVTAIDSVTSGAGRFWTYTVNGRIISQACDRYRVGPGDTVIWRFGMGSR